MSSNYCIPSHRLLKKLAETIGMPPIKRPTRQRHRTFIREWRDFVGLKQNEDEARALELAKEKAAFDAKMKAITDIADKPGQ